MVDPGRASLSVVEPVMQRVRGCDATAVVGDDESRIRLRALPPRFVESDELMAAFLRDMRALAWHTLGLRPFDVQLQAAAAMLRGISVEMATGEGKTLVGAIAAAGLSLAGIAFKY